ncbi:DUF2975 domain-containing protein [Proteiniclasticum sp. QWL-01]|uniref:DUF2975 domain-containing protein n=1 Tax=Proteiniclasticum sp. QWL-01 TaxID=3036945 RepID=UPI0024114070|nr:DUF2975 domain-containing protein [Proteiniclasticum sp. QWL-01]WFF74102.1 DUF2975 domain-containing protein [Proteiniclasticum sp. QWL-01]
MTSFKRGVLLSAMSVCILLCLYSYLFLWNLSKSFAESNPSIAYMRWPILIGCLIMLTGALFALLLGIRAAAQTEQKIFSQKTVRTLSWMGRSLAVSTAAILGIWIYALTQLGDEVGLVGAYLMIFLVFFFTASSVMFFLRDLFARAVEFRTENELTV